MRPPRGRRPAETEKERARSAIRSLVANPATDFAALDAEEFFAALRCACQDGLVNAALVAEAGRRIANGTAASRDLHQVLFTAGGAGTSYTAGGAGSSYTAGGAGSSYTAGGAGEWDEVRRAALAAVARQPHLAVEVLNLEVQRLGVPPVRASEAAGEGGFTARASLNRGGVTVEGPPCFDTSKKRASQRAAVSLLAVLVGIELPPAGGPVGNSGPQAGSPTVRGRRPDASTPAGDSPASAPAASAMSPADLEAWLDYEVSRPEPSPELAEQLMAGRLTVRSSYLLLFEAEPGGWGRHRTKAWESLASSASQAPGVLSMHAQARSWPPAAYVEFGERTAVAYLTTPDGPVVGEPAVAAGIRAARASAALALVGDLVPPVDADGGPGPRASTDNPVALLNERAQTGAISAMTYTYDASGPAHRPMFTCTAGCIHGADRYVGSAEAATKTAAKAAAAAELLEQVLCAERAQLAGLVRARREQTRSPEGIVARLLRAGCPVDFTGWSFRLGDVLPEPLAGYELPLLPALPVLAAVNGQTHTVDGQVHPSTRAWAAAVKTALEAVAARRVYPALDADGRDCWRLAPKVAADPALVPFFDTVAQTLLRPAGARLVIGDLPYAGRARPLGPDAADWADRAAGAAEGTAAAPLVIRLSPPGGDGLPLRAQLRVAGDTSGGGLLGRAEQRLVRRACRQWPPLERVRRDGTLGGAEAADLLGPAGQRLAALGVTAEWPAGLVTASGLGRQVIVASRAGSGSGTFSLADEADLTWQLSLDGDPLTDEETEAAAEAVEGVVQLRGRWVVIDAETRRLARQRSAGRLTGAQALGAALTGQVTVGGRDVGCSPTGRLADLIATLRAAGSNQHGSLEVPDGLHATLRRYQRVAVQWLVRTTAAGFGALLADDMGLGKTLTVIAYRLCRENAAPSLVVCPASLIVNWEREFARFAPGVAVRRYHATGRSLDGLQAGEVVVTTYGTLLRDAAVLTGVHWDLVVADEAQQIKNHRSQAARALRMLRPAARIAVTGTPVENSLTELWAILDWTNPGLFGSLTAFRERFGRAAEREAAEAFADRDAARRLGRLIAPFVMRRRKSDPDVVPELPDKVLNDRYVELTREQAALYQAATAEALDRIAASDGLHRRGQVLRLLQALRQICNSPAHYLREPADGWDAARQAARSGKLQVLEELLESIIVSGDAALIFTGYVSMGHLIRAHLAACGIRTKFIHGGVPAASRQQIVDRFQAGNGDALILSVRAAGTGLNLTRAGHVIHFDRPWNPAVEDQATDRAHRVGQHRLVEVHHLIAEGTIEDRIAGLLARKRELTEAVLPGEPTALSGLSELSDSELSALVSLGADLSTGGTA
ncbi:MAG TPA: SNF2-related protein [Pseudonocardiaceae bacterium]|nr:SNF2-related protein [Pseudonocardiaceae bacterium]